ncbi:MULTISPECIES: hypothetical protein [Arsenicicoccus]|uniref:hypothetical protein n=1 Tax=Arsenicicoccus TaxID=267408 RepID=UPI00257B5FA2|nr:MULTISPECIES: hypothetical protein [Arsenicicoccus]
MRVGRHLAAGRVGVRTATVLIAIACVGLLAVALARMALDRPPSSGASAPPPRAPSAGAPTGVTPTAATPTPRGPDTSAAPGIGGTPTASAAPSRPVAPKRNVAPLPRRTYPWHTGIVSTTFWVGEIFDPTAPDGSQRISTYDARWFEHYGGCDGVVVAGESRTERRTAAGGWFPTRMTPRENPFYLDVPFDDLNDPVGWESRCRVVPWADDPGYAGRCADRSFSYLKNRWVRLVGPNGATCYGQVQDAGPGEYHDAAYVFEHTDARPANRRYGGSGMDVSPALNGCLGFAELDGDTDRIRWQFVEASEVPRGPWTRLVTTSGVTTD